MLRLEGTVSGLSHERRVVGRERDDRPPAAVHVYRFRVQDRAVELRHGAAVPLNDGDAVAVVCAGRRAPLRVYAYANRTWGATLVEPAGAAAAMRGWLPAIPAVLLALAALALWPQGGGRALATAASVVAAVAATACVALAARGFLEYRRYRRAAARLDAAATNR